MNILSQKGELKSSFKLPQGYYFLPSMRVRSDNSIVILKEYAVNIYSKAGKKLAEWQEVPYSRDMDVAPDDSVYVISMKWGETHLVKFSKDGEVIFDQMLWGEADSHLKDPLSIAVASNGEVHILDGIRDIKVFTSKGVFLRKVHLPVFTDGISLNKENLYILHINEGLYIADSSGNIIQSFLGEKFSYVNDVVQNSQGRYFAPGLLDDRLISFNVSSPYSPNMPTGKINGKIDLSPQDQSWVPRSTAYIQGTDPAGNSFSGMTETSNTGEFSFNGIPLNSSYRIWTDQMALGLYHLKKQMLTGTLKRAEVTRKFSSVLTSRKDVNIFGIVKNKEGIPIHGVVITCGKHSAITALDGRYTLTIPGNSAYTLTAEKAGYSFKKSSRKLTLAMDDKLFVNFQEK